MSYTKKTKNEKKNLKTKKRLTGRSDLCIAGVFGAGKTRSLAVLLIALSCELSDFYAIVYTKENVAAKALAP